MIRCLRDVRGLYDLTGTHVLRERARHERIIEPDVRIGCRQRVANGSWMQLTKRVDVSGGQYGRNGAPADVTAVTTGCDVMEAMQD